MARTRKRRLPESNETVARKIWLAGLGAYGKSVEDAHGQIDKASEEASKFFHDLVSKGQSIEDHSREALRERISEAAGSNTRTVEEMIGRVRERMGVDDSVHARLDALARQVSALARKVTGLSLGKGKATPAKRRAAAPSGTRKPAGKGAAGPVSRRPAGKGAAKPARGGRTPKRARD